MNVIQFDPTQIYSLAAYSSEGLGAYVGQGGTLGGFDEVGNTALHIAVIDCEWTAVKELIKRGADVNAVNPVNALTPLDSAIRFSCLKVVEMLLEAGAIPDLKTSSFHSVGLYGEKGALEIAKILHRWGANIHSVSYEDRTPLHDAAEANSLEMVELLLELGANPNLVDFNKRTPLIDSVCFNRSGSIGVIEALVAAGTNLKHKDQKGLTALHYAAFHDHYDVTRLLISCGADIFVLTPQNQTAFDIATGVSKEFLRPYVEDNDLRLLQERKRGARQESEVETFAI